MSLPARREYLRVMRERYLGTKNRAARGRLLDEIQAATGYNRKYAVRLLSARRWPAAVKRRQRPRQYQQCLPVIALAWEALDYCCAERLHPRLVLVAEQLARHHMISLTEEVKHQLATISRATVGRRLAAMQKPEPRITIQPMGCWVHKSEVPIGRYPWNEAKPGALEVDLVEHNGGFASGHYAYTLTTTDVVTGWTRHGAVLGRGQAGVHDLLDRVTQQWPYVCWGLHADNGPEFLNDLVRRFAIRQRLERTRSRPYHKNDSPHVEERNRVIRELVGYDRYDTAEAVAWLNHIYELYDPYANLVLPIMKLAAKTRIGSRLRKTYDVPRPPLDRAIDLGVITDQAQRRLQAEAAAINPLALHRELRRLTNVGPAAFDEKHVGLHP